MILVIMLTIDFCIVAVLYYIFNLQTTIKLEDPIYFNKDAWIALIKEVRFDSASSFSDLCRIIFNISIASLSLSLSF